MTLKQTLHHLNLRSTHLLPKINKSIKITLILISLVSVSLFVHKITAAEKDIQTDTMTIDASALSGYYNKQSAIDKGNNQEAWINESLSSNVVSLNKAIAGDLPKNLEDIVSWRPGGLIGFTNKAIASLYQPPASGVQYIAQSIDSFLGKPTYAATGFGFDKLNGILNMWKTMRNAVYTIISLFFIITGIMIMLRVKISPQATVTIQSAIPSIISSLILVTFSYAIAGLLIDASNVFLGIVLSLIDSNWPLTEGIGKGINDTMTLGLIDFTKITNGYLVSDAPIWAASAIGGVIGWIAVGVATANFWVGLLAFGLILFAVFIFALVQIVKLFFGLAKCYINVIIQIILGPIQIGMGAIPGSKINFSTWLTQLIAQLAVFPSTIIFLVFSVFLTQTLKSSGDLWSPTLLGIGGLVGSIVGLACLAILSKIPDIVPEMIFNIKPSPLGKAIGESYKTPVALLKTTGLGAANNIGTKWDENSWDDEGKIDKTAGGWTKFKGALGRVIKDASSRK